MILRQLKLSAMIFTIIFSSIAFTGVSAGIGAEVVYDPWNFVQTQLSAAHSATQITNQMIEIRNQLQNLKNYDGNASQWSNAQSLLQQLANTTSQGNALSYSMQNMNTQFSQKFPGYQPQQNYDQAYQGWSSTTMDTLRNTLTSAGLQANSFATEQGTLDNLKQLSTSAQGRMQAVQAGNMIAAEQVGQTQKLRQLVISQTNAQNAYMASQVQQQQAQLAAENNLFNKPTAYPKYGTGQGFGQNNMPHVSH